MASSSSPFAPPPSLPASHDRAVQATNDDAFESKLAAQTAGYFSDPHLTALFDAQQVQSGGGHLLKGASSPPRRPPVINRGTFARVLLKNTLLRAFVKDNESSQVISLGAGFDTSAYALPPCNFVELDFDAVVARKATLAADVHSRVFESVSVGESGVTATRGDMRYALRSCDLRDITGLPHILHDAGVRPDAPTLILAEIVLVYMQPQDADRLVRALGQFLSGMRVLLLLEPTYAGDAFGRTMASNVASRGSPLQGLTLYPTPDSLVDRFRDLGFPSVAVQTMLQAFHKRVPAKEMRELQKVEFLDEVEELRLLLGHYVVLLAAAGDGADEMIERLDLSRFQGDAIR